MRILRRASLLIMLLPFLFYIIYLVTYQIHLVDKWHSLGSFVAGAIFYGVPCITIAGISWMWARGGGAVAMALSMLLLSLNVSGRVKSVIWGHPDFSFMEDVLVLTLPYAILLIGSVLAFISALMVQRADLELKVNKSDSGGGEPRGIRLFVWISMVVLILFFTIGIGIVGDMVLEQNLTTGLQIGLTLSAVPLLIGAALRWAFSK